MQPPQIAELLQDWALAEGFDRAGVTDLAPSRHGRDFEEWLGRGDHAGMTYLERRREARLDPRQIMPGARSALCVALQYHPLVDEDATTGDLWSYVARYARGRDYHEVMGKRLERLAARVRAAFPGCEARPYVDTGPVLERDLAARAGLGVIGKNTHLLDSRGGSWFLIGELFLSLDLAGGPGVSDLCGTCSECLTACPTGALPEPYRLDSRKCISYWTIEHRGAIPVEFRSEIGPWVFGCDICQEVCPINADALAGDHPALGLTAEMRELDLSALLRLDRETYTETFRGSAMKRARLEGLQRNAAVAMGNSRSQRYIDVLTEALSEADPMVRRHVVWALGRIAGTKAVGALRDALERERDAGVRAEIELALENSG